MKTIILILSLVLPVSVSFGQTFPKTNKPGERDLKDFIEKYNQEDHKFKIYPGEEEYGDLPEEHFKKFNTDSSLTEHFPGADRYYAKIPVFAPYGGFIVEPDTTVKLYLIIKDPLRNTIRK